MSDLIHARTWSRTPRPHPVDDTRAPRRSAAPKLMAVRGTPAQLRHGADHLVGLEGMRHGERVLTSLRRAVVKGDPTQADSVADPGSRPGEPRLRLEPAARADGSHPGGQES
jgi:hypothetical protein